MAVVNRFSREPQVAKFDPLTAEEIMKVPIGKQVMEDEQRAAADAQLAALYNTKSLEGDRERIEKRKSELEQKLMGITDEIAANGISRNTTNALSNLKREYDKELSASGDIGQANAFVGLQEQARKEFLSNPKNLEMGSDWALRYWDASVKGRSAFNEDGTYKSEFAGVAIPDYVVAGDEFRERAKAAATQKVTQDGTIITETNQHSLSSMYSDILNKYHDENSKEYRSMIAQGKDISDIERELTLAYNEALETTAGSRTPKRTAPGKKTKAQLEQEAESSRNWFQRAGTGIKPTGIILPSVSEIKSGEKAALAEITEATNREEQKEAEDRYMALKSRNDGYKRSFENTSNGRKLKLEVDKLKKQLPEGVEDLSLEETLALAEEKGFVDKLNAYNEAVLQYESAFSQMLKDGANPDIIVPDFIVKPTNKKDVEKWKYWQENERTTMASSEGIYNFESISGLTVNSKGVVVGDGTNADGSYTESAGGPEFNSRLTRLLKDQNAVKDFKIVALNQQSNIRNIGGLMSITLGEAKFLPDDLKPYGGHTVEVRYSLDDKATKQKVPGSESARNQYTTALNGFGNEDFSNFAMHNQDRMTYDQVMTPASEKNSYYFNDDNIKDRLSQRRDHRGQANSLGNSFVSDDKRVDIYLGENGKYRFGISKGMDGKGKQLPLTKGDLVSALRDRKRGPAEKEALRYIGLELDRIKSTLDIPEIGDMETEEEYEARIAAIDAKILESLEDDSTPIEFDNYYEFFKLLE